MSWYCVLFIVLISGTTSQKDTYKDPASEAETCDSESDSCTNYNTAGARKVVKSIEGQWQGEGAGAKVRRSIGKAELPRLDPFLMFDEFTGDKNAGFPDHPHRGFETVTYVLNGQIRHEDFGGHQGFLEKGDLQWMSAGRGIVHSEMPWGDEMCHATQLWVNLKSKDKMMEPTYQTLRDADILKYEQNGVRIKIIAGESQGLTSPTRTIQPVYFLDFQMDPGTTVQQKMPAGWNSLAYVLKGNPTFGTGADQKKEKPNHSVVFTDGDFIDVVNKSNDVVHFLLIGGEPIGEPVAQQGPFIMNTREEVNQALVDYRKGQNGFEKAVGWQSYVYKNK